MAKWIAGAIKHPGALHRQLGVPMGHTIPAARLKAAAAKGGTLGRRARLAQTLQRLGPHGPSGQHHSPTIDWYGRWQGQRA